MCLVCRHFCDNHTCVMLKRVLNWPGRARNGTGELLHKRIFLHGASFTRAETTSETGGSLGTPKFFGTGATLHLGATRLHVENWECRALKSSARCQTFGVLR